MMVSIVTMTRVSCKYDMERYEDTTTVNSNKLCKSALLSTAQWGGCLLIESKLSVGPSIHRKYIHI